MTLAAPDIPWGHLVVAINIHERLKRDRFWDGRRHLLVLVCRKSTCSKAHHHGRKRRHGL